MKAEELFPGNGNEFTSNNVTLRKGTIGACIQGAEILKSDTVPTEKEAILQQIAEYAEGLVQAFNWNDHITWNNPEIQKIFEETTHRIHQK